jgi:hypothetical protein
LSRTEENNGTKIEHVHANFILPVLGYRSLLATKASCRRQKHIAEAGEVDTNMFLRRQNGVNGVNGYGMHRCINIIEPARTLLVSQIT